MTLQQLKYIVTLDKERHFARAAAACNISQPGLTIQLKKLEEEIGVLIFDRSKVPLKTTPIGKEIIRRAKKILVSVDDIREFIIDEKNDLVGELRLGVVSTLSPYLIPLVITNFQKRLPKIEFIIQELSTDKLLDKLENGEIDMALMATPTGNNSVLEYPIFKEPFIAFLNRDHNQFNSSTYRVNPDDQADLLILEKEFCFNAQLLSICDLEDPVNQKKKIDFETSSIETLKNLVRANLGFSILPELSIWQVRDEESIKNFESPIPVREISLVVSERFTKQQILEQLRLAIWESLPKKFKEDNAFVKIRWDDSPYFRKAIKQYS